MRELERIMELQAHRTQRVKFEVEHIIGSRRVSEGSGSGV
jgi:hypothetical protein